MEFFGTDGIRDRAGQGRLSAENVLKAGRALGRLAVDFARDRRPVRVCLGRDPRPSGEGLVQRLTQALNTEGIDVVDLGVVPTPAVAWAVAEEGYDLGIAVSASHNPPEDNGIKPFAPGGRKLTREEEERVEAWMGEVEGPAQDHGDARALDGAARYAAATASWLAKDGRLDGMAIVVDLSAGAASTTAPAVLRALGADLVVLHPASSRPINESCGTEHPKAWLAAVKGRKGAVGLAFDGDADRVLLADEGGHVLDGDDALAILTQDAVRRGALPGARVVSTVMANLGLEERLADLGVVLERTAVGDRNVAERMRETNAPFGAEASGHVVLERDGALIGDGVVAGVRLLQASRRLEKSLTELRRETPRYPQILRNVRVKERRPLETDPDLAPAIREAQALLGDEGRMVVRYSGTEPLLRVMAEGHDADVVERAVALVEKAAAKLA